jgi:hypothetical protein
VKIVNEISKSFVDVFSICRERVGFIPPKKLESIAAVLVIASLADEMETSLLN